MISITYNNTNINFEWNDVKNHYDSNEVILNGVVTSPVKIKNKQKIGSEFFIIKFPNFNFIISNGLVNGTHNELGTFSGSLNNELPFIPIAKESIGFSCDCDN